MVTVGTCHFQLQHALCKHSIGCSSSPMYESLPCCGSSWPHFWLCGKPRVQLVQQQGLLFRSEQTYMDNAQQHGMLC